MDSTTSSLRATPTLLLQQQLSNDGPRTQLRDSLLSYLRVHDDVDDQSPVVSATAARWKPIIAAPPAPPSAHQQQPPLSATSLLVGKPDQLLESLQAFAAHSRRIAQACHASPPDITNIATNIATNTTPQLDWLRALTRPAASFRTYTGDERVLDLLRLRHALQHDAANFDELTAPARRQVAFQLARELPHFDRDLTAYYLQPAPDTPEYELHVAHSILRLHSPPTPDPEDLLTWRHTGLVHVLAVAALHMPAVADWFPHNPPSPTRDPAASALRECLTRLNADPTRYRTHMQDLVTTLLTCEDTATTATTTQAFFHTLDTAAVLMRVKSNAPANAPGGHCLDSALATFPTEEECALDAAKLPQLWASIKPALEQALPPSLLLPRPAAAAVWSDT